MRALIFPGQGSQIIGMGKSIHDSFKSARDVFDEVNDSLNFNLTKVMFEGPESELLLTENAQPAIMAVSLAIIRVLEKDFNFNLVKNVAYMAGHSLGEYSALTSAKVFDVKVCADILKARGKAMQFSTPLGVGGMVAVLGINSMEKIKEMIEACAEKSEVCVVANDNCEGQIVISGNMKSIDNIILRAKEFGATRAIKLAVSGSFHSPLMHRASEIMAEKLNNIDLKDANIKIVSNVSASTVTKGNEIKALLIEQIVKSVRWKESMEYLVKNGITEVVEVGQGSVLTGLMKRINDKVKRVNLQNSTDIENFINNL